MTGGILVVLTSILTIAVLAIIAVANGINGVVLAAGMAIVGGLGGYEAKILRDKFKKGGEA